jgi:hypothetical protein
VGSPPPIDAPSPAASSAAASGGSCGSGGISPDVSGGVDLIVTPTATICGFAIGPPRLKFSLSTFLALFGQLPPIPPKFFLAFKLSCDLSDPVNVSSGLDWGAGRCPIGEPDPDDMEDAA